MSKIEIKKLNISYGKTVIFNDLNLIYYIEQLVMEIIAINFLKNVEIKGLQFQ